MSVCLFIYLSVRVSVAIVIPVFTIRYVNNVYKIQLFDFVIQLVDYSIYLSCNF